MTTDGAKGLIGSLLHGLEILDMFERDRSEIGIGEMAQQLGLHRSTTSRLAATLAVAGYLEPHLCCVAGPVFDRAGAVVASISVSGPDSRIGDESIPAIAESVRRAAWQISARLGAPREIPGWNTP